MSLQKIQAELKAPKGQTNSFGKYKYRSCEDIVEAVKPVLAKYDYALLLGDDVVEVGGRVYVKATASIIESEKVLYYATAYAREPENKKGMDESQITGAASSYARKYALNGLFAIDDTKDADTQAPPEEKKTLDNLDGVQEDIFSCVTPKALNAVVKSVTDEYQLTEDQKGILNNAYSEHLAKLKESK